jgi:uncharacterized protein (TIGR03067 family)
LAPNSQDLDLPLIGIWQGEDLEFIEGLNPDEHLILAQNCRWVVTEAEIQFKWHNNIVFSADYQTDSKSRPKEIDVQLRVPGGTTRRGIFRRDAEMLEVCTVEPNGRRPKAIRKGIVARPADGSNEARTGLVGYARLRRLERSFEVDELQGTWIVERMESDGAEVPMGPGMAIATSFDGNRYKFAGASGTFVLNPDNPSTQMDMIPDGQQLFHCLYEIKGDTMRFAASAPGGARPEDFQTKPGELKMALQARRAKPDEVRP